MRLLGKIRTYLSRALCYTVVLTLGAAFSLYVAQSQIQEKVQALDSAKMILFWDGFASDGTTPLSVPAGWTDISADNNNKFVRGNTPANVSYSSGDILSGGGSAQHTVSASTPTIANNNPVILDGGVGSTIVNSNHAHSQSGSISVSAGDNNPTHRTLRIIRNTGIASTIPQGAIAMFDSGSVPTGWTRQSAQDNKMIKINSTAGTSSGSDTHSHTITWPGLASAGGQFIPQGTGHTPAGATHTHTTPNTSLNECNTGSGCVPPYVKPLLAKADSNVSTPDGIIALFDSNPGGGWAIQSNANGTFNQQFLRPAAAFDGTSVGATTHTHATSISSTTPTCAGGCAVGTSQLGSFAARTDHTHTLNSTLTTGTYDNTPEYANFVIAKKALPSMLMFWDGSDGSIPAGWSKVTDFNGRLPRGETPGNYGDIEGNSTHTHTNQSVSIGTLSATFGNALGTNTGASAGHSHSNPSVNTISSDSNFPDYKTLKIIKYDAGIPNVIPAGAITIFDDSPGIPTIEQSPGNPYWSRYSTQDNKFVAIDNTTTGSSTSLTAGVSGSDTRTHSVTWSGSLGASSGTTTLCLVLFCGTAGGAPNAHTHTAPGSTTSSAPDTRPPYVGVLMAKTNFDTATLSTGITALFAGDPGSGWIIHSATGGKYYQKFLRPQATYSEAGGGAAFHTHTATGTSGQASGTASGAAGASGAAIQHTHPVTATFTPGNSESNYTSNNNYYLPPYFNVIIAEKVDFKLDAYRWFEDSNNQDVTDPWSSLDVALNSAIPTLPTAYRPPDLVDELRLRIRILVNNNTLNVGDVSYRLQYKKGTDASCTSGTWTEIGAENSGEIWRFASSGVTDGASISTSRISSNVTQRYAKSNPTGTNVNSVPSGQTMEWDFHIQHNGAEGAVQYSFRIVEDGNLLLSEYTFCPTLVTAPQSVNELRHGNFFEDSGNSSERGFFWAN